MDHVALCFTAQITLSSKAACAASRLCLPDRLRAEHVGCYYTAQFFGKILYLMRDVRHPSVRYQLRPILSTGTEPLLPMIFSSGTVSSYRFWMPALVVRVINT
jgi:hypothetical protein